MLFRLRRQENDLLAAYDSYQARCMAEAIDIDHMKGYYVHQATTNLEGVISDL